MGTKEKEEWEFIITDNKTVRWYFAVIMYESLLYNRDKVVLSTIHKYKYLVECLLTLFRPYGLVMDTDYESNPMEEKIKGKNLDVLNILKYHLVRSPTNQAILKDMLKEKKTQEILTYLLDRIKIDKVEREFNKW